jgi:hypothetical protein
MEAQAMADRPPVVLDTQSTITERTGGGESGPRKFGQLDK